jgi:hypothetical protein
MIIWSGWGIVVVLILAVCVFVAITAGGVFMTSFGLAYGPANAFGIVVGGLLAASGIFLFAKWRESGESRIFIDEASGERIEVRRSAGSLFFIPSRYWTWIALALTALLAFTQFSADAPGQYN